MAIDTSEITIINEALNLLGVKRTTATKVATPSASGYDAIAELAAESYERHRNAMLRDYQWNFAIVRDTLTVDGTAPDWGFSFRYALPSDSLRILQINQELIWVWGVGGWYQPPTMGQWKVEGQFILSSISDDLEIKYIGLENDAANMDPLFIEALAMQLAGKWSRQLTGKDGQGFKADADRMLQEVRTIDSMEGIPDAIQTTDWLSARER